MCFFHAFPLIHLAIPERRTLKKPKEPLVHVLFLCCRMAYVEFKTEAEADKALEEKQGTEIDGRAMVIDYTGEKSQQENQKGTFPDL